MFISSIDEKLNYEFYLIAKQFFPYEPLDEHRENTNFIAEHKAIVEETRVIEILMITKGKKHFVFDKDYKFGIFKLEREKEIKRIAKIAFYEAMQKLTHKKLDWGCLTGVHPTKIAYEIYNQTNDLEQTKILLMDRYKLNSKKASLLCQIIKNQINSGCEQSVGDKVKDCIFYVNIPFCTSKCSYCSFISAVIGKCQELVDPYVDALVKEIECMREFIKKKKIKIDSVYIGGGTPTALSSEQLEKILKACNIKDLEFTVEAGRPDTITQEKLDIMKKYNVTRISINPQTFNQTVLNEIGRSHTIKDIYEKFDMARAMRFDINMDLIAGLPKDTYSSFKHSLSCAIKLMPQNITVHTLSLKTKAELIKDTSVARQNKIVKKMINYSFKKLHKNYYSPYYVYRQKNMLENQENVGWSKRDNLCFYNIESMEDFTSVIACGANSVSKRVFPGQNRIERCDCPKDIKTYIEKIDKLIENKKEFFN